MEVRFVQRGTEIDDKLRSYMEGKVSKLEKFFRKILNSQVVVSLHKESQCLLERGRSHNAITCQHPADPSSHVKFVRNRFGQRNEIRRRCVRHLAHPGHFPQVKARRRRIHLAH